jgi:hypothetical protein
MQCPHAAEQFQGGKKEFKSYVTSCLVLTVLGLMSVATILVLIIRSL